MAAVPEVGTAPSGAGPAGGVPAPVDLQPPSWWKRKGYTRRDTVAAFLFLAPSLIHFMIFILGLVVASLVISTWRWDLLTPSHEVGLHNYATMFFHDPLFWTSLKATVYFVLLTIPTGIVLSLALAMAVNTKLRGIVFFRTAYFIPVVSSMVAVAVVWRWVFNNDFGILNWFLGLFGVHKIDWLGNPLTAMPAIALMSVWKGLGFTMTLFLAGLQSIPQHLYEAAELDGAGKWKQFVHVTWPLLTPTTFFVSVISIIGSFNVFDAVYLMTQGGPGNSTTVYNFYLFNQAFRYFHMGYAAAMAWVLFVIIAALSYLQFRFLNRRVQYELG
ncbi:MAG TPA: sugar ABC transporter permease [Actinomycetota bacterium]|jgi:multiple sugar transport system permease protein|nr:sugar ABC transporter permease [Actinomycetota bacterium]